MAPLATVLTVLMLAAPARAQWDFGGPPVMDWPTPHLQSQQWCNISWCRHDDDAVTSPPTPEERARARRRMRQEARAERRRERRQEARDRRTLKRHGRKLRFIPAPEASDRVFTDLLAHFAPADAPGAAQLQAELQADPPMGIFNEHLEEDTDWSPHDAGDVYAFSLITLWLTIADATSTTSKADNAVRADIRAAMAASRAASAAGNAEQQERAERIASWTVLLTGQYNFLVRNVFGVDLSAVKLTRKGIVPR